MMSKSESDNVPVKDLFKGSGFPDKTAMVFSTWFGIGLLPLAPGTFGSLAAIPLILLTEGLALPGRILILALLTGTALWSADRCRKLLSDNDPSMVIIDEMAGFYLAMLLLPMSWLNLAAAFAAFRFFDILKPFPIKQVEAIGGGIGIVFDDLLAGLYAYLATWLTLSFLN